MAILSLARFFGDVAQLGERCLRKAEAEGSNPFISTIGVVARAVVARAFLWRAKARRRLVASRTLRRTFRCVPHAPAHVLQHPARRCAQQIQ